MEKRPLTAKEIQQRSVPIDNSTTTIMNSSKQLIKIHMKQPKGVDFFIGAQDVSLKPNQAYVFKSSRLWDEQIERLCKQGILRVVGKTEKY